MKSKVCTCARGWRRARIWFLLGGERRRDAVAAADVLDEHSAAVGGLPEELRGLEGIVRAAPEDAAFDAEACEDRREVGDLAERIGQVADVHYAAQLARDAMAAQEIAHQRLAARERFIGDDVPGPGGQAAFAHVALDQRATVGAHLEVVLDQDGVAVEHEVAVLRIASEDVEEQIEEADEARAVALVGEVPLAIPVRVGDEDDAPALGNCHQQVCSSLVILSSRPALAGR
jgi:hypothetical protein